MSLLDDFKTAIGVTGTSNDQYYVTYYLRPAIQKASSFLVNVKETTVTLTPGTQTYDLTSALIASPVVSSAGIYELIYDSNFISYYQYKKDFYIRDRTTLYFVDSDFILSGTYKFKYRAYYTTPTISPYVETDLPDELFPAIVSWSSAKYGIEQLGGNRTTGVMSKSEGNQSVSFGSIDSQVKALQTRQSMAEQEFMDYGAQSGIGAFSLFQIPYI